MTSWRGAGEGCWPLPASTPTPAKQQKEAIAQKRGGQQRGTLTPPSFAFSWIREWAAVQILRALPPSSPWHPGPASLSPEVQTSNIQLSTLSWPALSLSPFLGGHRAEPGGGGGILGAAPREPSSGAAETAIPKSNTRGRQDARGRRRGSARWFPSV